MNTRILTTLLLFLFIQKAHADLPEQCGILKQQFESEIERERLAAKEELNSATGNYEKKILEALAAEQTAGNLDEVLILKSELEKAKTEQLLDSGVAPKSLRSHRRDFAMKVREIRTAFDEHAKVAQTRLIDALKTLEKAETQANRIELAVAVREFREDIEKTQPPRMADFELISRIEGVWQISFPNGSRAVLLVSESGTARQADDEKQLDDATDVRLRVVGATKTPAVIFDSGIILNRYTLSDTNTMQIEQWFPVDRFPDSPSYNGTATRIR